MNDRPGFLEFFILEASDYVEQLDGLLLGGGSGSPDGDALQRIARALRGTATMAKLPTLAELAGGVERVGRAIQEGAIQWDPTIGGALVAAIDDLKLLLHSARGWSPVEDRRAVARSEELARLAPPRPRVGPEAGATATAGTSQSFLSTEAANIAAGLELLTTRAGDADTASNVLRRIRALRGVAGVKEVAPLASTLEATEDAGRGLESAEPMLTADARRLLEAAATYLRTLSSALRTGGDVNAGSEARDAFDAAHDAWSSSRGDRERVVPIADLFYSDGASGVVEASDNPPTTASERLRLELVSLGEHLRQVVDSSRAAKDAASVARSRRDVLQVLQALESAAESFGEHDIADFVRAHEPAANTIDFLGLSALEDLASILSAPGVHGEHLRARASELAGRREIATAIGAGFGHETPLTTAWLPEPVAPTPASASTHATIPTPVSAASVPAQAPEPAPPPAAPVVSLRHERIDISSSSLIDSSIAALEAFASTPMLAPALLPEDDAAAVVPIQSLLYHGRAALDRAVEIRDALRHAGSTSDPEALEELFDLLELARAE